MVYILLGTGFEPMEAVVPGDLLRRGGVEVCYAGLGGRVVTGAHGITLTADCTIDELREDQAEMVILPGGLGGVRSILACAPVLDFVRGMYASGRFVAAICAAPTVLAFLGITDGRQATCYPGMEDQMGGATMVCCDAIRDGTVITGRAAGAADCFGLLCLAALKGQQTATRVADAIVYRT